MSTKVGGHGSRVSNSVKRELSPSRIRVIRNLIPISGFLPLTWVPPLDPSSPLLRTLPWQVWGIRMPRTDATDGQTLSLFIQDTSNHGNVTWNKLFFVDCCFYHLMVTNNCLLCRSLLAYESAAGRVRRGEASKLSYLIAPSTGICTFFQLLTQDPDQTITFPTEKKII